MRYNIYEDIQTPRKLPIFMGYTVDERLREFRKVDIVIRAIEFIPFESDKGQDILRKYRRYLEYMN